MINNECIMNSSCHLHIGLPTLGWDRDDKVVEILQSVQGNGEI